MFRTSSSIACWLALICAWSAAAQQPAKPDSFAADVPATLTTGLRFCSQGEYDRAIMLLDGALDQATDPALLQSLGACYLDAGYPLKAVAAFQKLVDAHQSPQDQNLVFLARSYLKTANYFGSRLKKNPGSAEFLAILQSAIQQGSTNARAGFETASRRSPYLHPDLTFAEAVRLFSTHPNDPALLYVLTVLSGERAIESINQAQQRYSDSISVQCLRAEILAARGRNDEARQQYEQIGNSPDATVTVFHDAAMFFRRTGDWQSALKYFRKERAAAPNDERAQCGISDSLLHLRRFEELRAFLEPLAAAGNCTWAAPDLARAEQELGNLNLAILQMKKAALCDPHNASLHYRLARLFQQAGRTEEAARELQLFTLSRARTSPPAMSQKAP